VVCLSVTVVSPAKLLNRSRCRLGYGLGWAKESCVRWQSRSPTGMDNFYGNERPIVKCSDALPWAVQKRLNWSRCRLGCGLLWAQETMYRLGVQIIPYERAILAGNSIPFWGKWHARACPRTLPWAVQKWLNRSKCHLACGHGWVQGSMY